MKSTGKYAAILLAFVLLSFGTAYWVKWNISSDYVIKIETKGASGTISGLKGLVDFDPKNLKDSKIDVSVDVNTLDLGSGLKTRHAKNDGFLNVEKYSTIQFKSSSFGQAQSRYFVNGDITIKGVTKKVSIPFDFVEKGNEGTFNGEFKINRLDFGLEKMGVGEVIAIEIKLPVKK